MRSHDLPDLWSRNDYQRGHQAMTGKNHNFSHFLHAGLTPLSQKDV
jgi:hypothetical protein